MPSLSTVRAANAKFSPAFVPVALFLGGTSGIGQAMAEAFARYTRGNAHIIIVGRNGAAAESIIASFPRPTTTPAPAHEFVECDVTLMKNVRQATAGLLSRLPKLNYLVLSPGIITLKGRDETVEGIDRKLAVHYYARWKFTRDLIPLLRKAKEGGEDARVYSVLAPSNGSGKYDLASDFGLKKTFSVANAGKIAPIYNDLMMEKFAADEPEIAFTHAYPGFVRTPILHPSNWLIKVLYYPLYYLILYPFTVSKEVCAEYMLYGLFSGERGVFRRGKNGEDLGKPRYRLDEDARDKLWAHTVETTEV